MHERMTWKTSQVVIALFVGSGGDAWAQASTAPAVGFKQKGRASYYAAKFDGRRTASGERFSKAAFTAAHRRFPFQTMLRITNPATGQSCVVRVNDRGPFSKNRELDVSPAAARQLGMLHRGWAKVDIEIIGFGGRPNGHLAASPDTNQTTHAGTSVASNLAGQQADAPAARAASPATATLVVLTNASNPPAEGVRPRPPARRPVGSSEKRRLKISR